MLSTFGRLAPTSVTCKRIAKLASLPSCQAAIFQASRPVRLPALGQLETFVTQTAH